MMSRHQLLNAISTVRLNRTLRHAFISAALDAGVPLRDVHEAASHSGVCGWPRSRRRTIQETSSGPKLSAKGGGAVRSWRPTSSHNRVAAVSPQAWASFG